VDTGGGTGGDEVAGAQRPAAAGIAAKAKARAASGPPLTAAALPRPTTAPSMRVSQFSDSSCASASPATSAPSKRPALLPKSLATTAGPKSLMFCSGCSRSRCR
jgi:hypothetical protein